MHDATSGSRNCLRWLNSRARREVRFNAGRLNALAQSDEHQALLRWSKVAAKALAKLT